MSSPKTDVKDCILEVPLKKLERTYPANTTVLYLENHFGERGHECSIEGCRDIWFYGDGDVRWFESIGTVCATHGFLIPRMSYEEMSDELPDHVYCSGLYNQNRYEVDMFPTMVYTSQGNLKEFISSEGQKRKDELEQFLRSRRK